ncbi:MAG: 16S rRNA (guanine(966)-N(2))-methyltransferase RsmD [Candidatus Excrementavichristensenella sp.]
MRIIAGEAKGRRLFAPEGRDTRPTADRVRESLFGILSPRLEEARVLDLFAGSGALGLEALSRGAKSAVLCDRAEAAGRAILRNVSLTGCTEKVQHLHCDWRAALRRLRGQKFDLVFLDPPYDEPGLYAQALEMLGQMDLLGEDALIVLERTVREAPRMPDGFRVCDSRRYGDTAIDFVQREGKPCV